ncbi:copper homeostasis protein CutC [Psychromonas sp. SR45-3]|uniref:copper homeostasis protein CutC n=1 Tax=Psychromonas sp. SR45-3 TaxID=2760930 RepID=UPI0015FBEC12|nr:copper homeostasis protein CutC [Psychromonas sp. SR45-3]MBB1272160.1 copper homeostasis protein CutC [Psychromonas sp. SR45-3]
MVKECCVGSYIEAKRAYENGANRIELCDNLLEGGTTPSYGTIKNSVSNISIPINVIIRPRSGNFIYSDEEFEIMLDDIKICKDLMVNGIVYGVLNNENKIDVEKVKIIMAAASDLKQTFHMAFDEIENKKEAIDILVSLKVDRILTKGGKNSALENLQCLQKLITYAQDKIIIIPGGGVNKDNLVQVVKETGAKEVHGSKIV